MAQETALSGMSGVEKASLLLVALGTDAAGSVLKKLSPEEVKAVGAHIAQLRNIEPSLKETVLTEFTSRHQAGSSIMGADYARQILEQALGAAEAQDMVAEIASDQNRGALPFSWLKSVGAPKLSACLCNERPQVIALVLAHLPPFRAAEAISQLPENVQGDVAYRLGYMQSVSPETAKAVDEILKAVMSGEGSAGTGAVGGVHSLVAILNNADRATEAKILQHLEQIEAGAAESIKAMLFAFEDMAKLDDLALRTIIQECEQEDVRLAMKGSTEEIREAFFKNMSERAAEAMKEDLEMMGRVKVRDVEAAQRRMMTVVRKLDEEGTISIRSEDGEEFV